MISATTSCGTVTNPSGCPRTDLAARPIFHHTRNAIEAHLTIVFTALPIARDLRTRPRWTIKPDLGHDSRFRVTSPYKVKLALLT